MSNRDTFLGIYKDVWENGIETSPRSSKVKEIENWSGQFDSSDPCTSFKARNFKLSYAKREFLWYLNADRYDHSISEHAGFWKSLTDPKDNGFNSNYGVYIFGQGQFDRVARQLIADQDTRQAIIYLGHAEQVRHNNPDNICTFTMGFRIRDGKLNMSVHMRSWDVLLGMTNDVFAFSMVHLMMVARLKAVYPTLELGTYHHTADSLHVYEVRNGYKTIQQIIVDGADGHYFIDVPKIQDDIEVEMLIANHGKYKTTNLRQQFEFTKWLNDV